MRPLASVSFAFALAVVLAMGDRRPPATLLQGVAVTGFATPVAQGSPGVASPATSPAASPVARSPAETQAFWRGVWTGTTADGGSLFFLHNGTIVTSLQISVRCPQPYTRRYESPPLRALGGTPIPPPPAAEGWEFYTEIRTDPPMLRSGVPTATTGPERLEFKARLVNERMAEGVLSLTHGFGCGQETFVTQWTASKA
ncbi:MAG: hypothetical protein M3Q03_03825 [Chloroflexota bacterium]|nr:hypothetical protein [Chloroflexota bacterium]